MSTLNIPIVTVNFERKIKDKIDIKPEHILRFEFLKSGLRAEYTFELDLPRGDYQDLFDADDLLHLSTLSINGVCLSGVAIRKVRFSSATEKEWVFVKYNSPEVLNTREPKPMIMTKKDDIITIWGFFKEINWMENDL